MGIHISKEKVVKFTSAKRRRSNMGWVELVLDDVKGREKGREKGRVKGREKGREGMGRITIG